MAIFVSRDATVSSSSSQVEPNVVWRNDGLEFLKPIRQRDDVVSVDAVSVNRVTMELLAAPAAAVVTAIKRDLIPVAKRGFELWPEASGFSKSQLSLTIDVAANNNSLTATYGNAAPYAEFIERGTVVDQLIFIPGELAASRMASTIAAEIVK